MDFILGADVDATCRFVEDEYLGGGQQPPPHNDLLLVATRKLADWLFDRPMANFQFLQFLAGDLSFTG